MQRIANGPGKRSGEKKMPAITIPHRLHRMLRTTGSSVFDTSSPIYAILA
ncbi:MAG: hypothetical protein QRY74_00465 [Chlamydia sp.]